MTKSKINNINVTYFVSYGIVIWLSFGCTSRIDLDFDSSDDPIPMSENDSRLFLNCYLINLPEMDIINGQRVSHGFQSYSFTTTVHFKLPSTQVSQDWLNYLLDAMSTKGTPMKLEEPNFHSYGAFKVSPYCNYGLLGYFESENIFAFEYLSCGD